MNAEKTGRLTTNMDVDPGIYPPEIQKGIELIQGADFVAQFYDRDTTPEMADEGMNMFMAFWDDPTGDIDAKLAALEEERAADLQRKRVGRAESPQWGRLLVVPDFYSTGRRCYMAVDVTPEPRAISPLGAYGVRSIGSPMPFSRSPLTIYAIWVIGPTFYTFYLSLTNWDGLSRNPGFVGLCQLSALVFRPGLSGSRCRNNLVWLLIFITIPLALGLALAMIFNGSIKGDRIFKVSFYSPMVLSFVVIGLIFSWLYHPAQWSDQRHTTRLWRRRRATCPAGWPIRTWPSIASSSPPPGGK